MVHCVGGELVWTYKPNVNLNNNYRLTPRKTAHSIQLKAQHPTIDPTNHNIYPKFHSKYQN